jgi:hypothetical protein
MDASLDCKGKLRGADAFVDRLQRLTSADLAALGHRVSEAHATAAADLEWCRATATVSVELRRLHRSRAGAIASVRAGEAVLTAPGASMVPHDRLVQVARTAGDVARSLVAGGPPSALAVLGHGWEPLVETGARSPQPRASRDQAPAMASISRSQRSS